MKKNERLQSVHILSNVLQEKTPLLHLLQPHADLSPLSKALCFGVCRHYCRLEAIANTLIEKKPKDLDIWICILMGLYQLHFLRIPDYAVVKETVDLLTPLKKSWAKGLLNAVLRRYCRDEALILTSLSNNRAFIDGHPDWLMKRIQQHWPTHWQHIVKSNDEHPPMSLRINSQRTTVNDYLKRLHDIRMEARPLNHSRHGIVLTTPCDVKDLPGFSHGDISVQDEAAQLAAAMLMLKPNLRLLDACCAPGGKTAHILETQPDLSICLGLDIEKNRLSRVHDNLKRLNLQATLIQGDGLQPQTWWDGLPFDRILLDAPCSATGVIRRHPDIKILRAESDILKAAALQHDLLNALWPLLATDGILVYATCSIMPEENEEQIARFVNEHQDCRVLNTEQPWGHPTGHGRQVLPGENNMDGFFYSQLCKR